MIRDLQTPNPDQPAKRRHRSNRIGYAMDRVFPAAVTGLASGMANVMIEWLLHHLSGM